MNTKYKFSIVVIIFLLIIAPSLARAGYNNTVGMSDGGEITVYNNSTRDLYITISGRNEGSVSAGQSETFSVRYGEHRCEAGWDGGSINKYIRVSKTDPRASWYISKDDIRSHFTAPAGGR